jgi:hypothetical protein
MSFDAIDSGRPLQIEGISDGVAYDYFEQIVDCQEVPEMPNHFVGAPRIREVHNEEGGGDD